LIKITAIKDLNTIVYFSVNSATCFDLTDQHQTGQHYDWMWRVIWECRSQRLATYSVRLGVHIYVMYH